MLAEVNMFKCLAGPRPTQHFPGLSPKRARSLEGRSKSRPLTWHKRAITDTGLACIWSNCNLFEPKQAQKGPWTWGAPETSCLVVQNPKGEDRVSGRKKLQNSNISHPHFHILVLQQLSFNESAKILALQSTLPKNQITSDNRVKSCYWGFCFWGAAVPG